MNTKVISETTGCHLSHSQIGINRSNYLNVRRNTSTSLFPLKNTYRENK